MILPDYNTFWDWKRSDIMMKFYHANYEWEEFLAVWSKYKGKTNEAPEKGSGDLTDYYYWKTAKQYGAYPAYFEEHVEPAFRRYYDDVILPLRRKRAAGA